MKGTATKTYSKSTQIGILKTCQGPIANQTKLDYCKKTGV